MQRQKPPRANGKALSRRDLAPTGSVTKNERSALERSSEATAYPAELPGSDGHDTPPFAEFPRTSRRAIPAARFSLSRAATRGHVAPSAGTTAFPASPDVWAPRSADRGEVTAVRPPA